MLTLTQTQRKELLKEVRHCINIMGAAPRIEIAPGNEQSYLHFVWATSQVAGNAADHNSMVGLHRRMTSILRRQVGTLWVGLYNQGTEFHLWATVS